MVKEGESGYWKTDWAWAKQHAQDALNEINHRLGITPEEADEILTRSMFPPKKPKRKLKEANPDRLNFKHYALKHGRPCRFISTWDGWKCGCGRWSFTTSVFDTTGVEKRRAKHEWLDHKARVSEALDPDDIPPKGALMQVPSPYRIAQK